MKLENNVNGLLNVYKPSGPTSRDIVNIIQKKLNTKAGHTGTLDPLASGVLIITLGKYTKLSEIITSKTKEYEAEVIFGIETDTLDTDGEILKNLESILDREQIVSVLDKFKTTYYQEVPKYSAVKVNGKKLYEYARNNIDVKLPKKEVTIYDIKLLDFKIEGNKTIIKFYTKVSKGTYIRSLIRDIAYKLDTVGVMSALTRISQGNFNIKDAYSLENIDNGNYKLLSISDAIDIDVDKEGNELAIYHQKDGKLRMWKMLYRN